MDNEGNVIIFAPHRMLLNNQLPKPIQHSGTVKINSCPNIQKIFHILWTPKFYVPVHKSHISSCSEPD
jgi:hypothetical protein